MGILSVSELVHGLFRDTQPARSGDPAGNDLFRMLYNAYCCRNGINVEFSDITDHHKACKKLYNWYVNRYDIELNMLKGTRGQDRTAGSDAETYTFDRLYCDDRQFRNYLETELPQSGSQDLLSFVLHTAVAFLVPLQELDHVLQILGFHPLHVKNLHHLSIAYVLLLADSHAADPSFNPFAEVKKLYFKALQILDDSDVPAEDSYNYADLETRMIREVLLLRKGLAKQNFDDLVAQNRAALNMRHSMILSDFHRLSAVFIHIFDTNSQQDCFDQPEEAYSFYRFVARFCQNDLNRKHFREHMTSMIDRKMKHPTRNVLILLWLYTYCFAFLPGVYIEDKTYRRITKQLKKTDPQWAEEATDYYHDEFFDIYGFITKQPQRSVPQTFRGSDFFAFINGKLMLEYGWGQLNDKLPFDHYIHGLEKLTLQLDHDGCCRSASYEHNHLAGFAKDVYNVPFPLVAITQIFEQLKQLHIEKAARSKRLTIPICPLACSIYEQL